MNRLLGAVFALAIVVAFASSAEAQVYQVYYPGTPVTSYYAPAPVAATSYYAPAPVAATTYYAPAPVAAPVATYYAPTAVATTRYRPLIGGNVTRWRYVNRPTVVYPSTVAYYPAW
jgi:hypothetical protein